MGDFSHLNEAPQKIQDIANAVKNEHFPELKNANIFYCYNDKQRKRNNKITFATISTMGARMRLMTATDVMPDGYDYWMELDGKLFEALEEPDVIRIIRHELRHCYNDPKGRNQWRLVAHDYEDFYDEVDLNRDDPKWGQRVYAVCESVHAKDQDNDE